MNKGIFCLGTIEDAPPTILSEKAQSNTTKPPATIQSKKKYLNIFESFYHSYFILDKNRYDVQFRNEFVLKFIRNIYPGSFRYVDGLYSDDNKVVNKRLIIGDGSYFLFLDKLNSLVITVYKSNKSDDENKDDDNIRFDFYGLNHSNWNTRIYNAILMYIHKQIIKSYDNNVKNTCLILYRYANGRLIERHPFNHINKDEFIHPDKEMLLNKIITFKKSKHIYKKYNMKYSLGILLYGEPGTGKSLCAKLISSIMNQDLLITDIESLDEYSREYKPSIMLLEEIDTMFQKSMGLMMRKNKTDGNGKESYYMNSIMRDFLINIDNLPSGSIIIATTNHIENLDPAVIRDGRFDVKVKFENFTEEEAIEMIKKFDENVNDIRKLVDGGSFEGINPAKLENIIRQKKLTDIGLYN